MREVKVYVTATCGYCHAAKRLLTHKGVPFDAIDCSDDAETRRWLVEQTGRRTVPQVFIDGVPVGGYDDLRALDDAGRLDLILQGKEAPQHV